MDELTAVRESGEAFGPQQPAPSDRLVQRVLATTREGTGTRSSRAARRTPTPWRAGRRPLLWAAPIAAAAAVAALVVSGVLPLGGSGSQPPTVALDARTVLLAAAQTARTTSTPVPPPGSYVYSRSAGRWSYDLEEVGTFDTLGSSETWLAADGRRAGLTVETYEKGFPEEPGVPAKPGPIRESTDHPADCPRTFTQDPVTCSGPGYLGAVPQDPAGAIDFLRRGGPGKYDSELNDFGKVCGRLDDKVRCRDRTDSEVVDAAWTVLGEHLLTPQARAAVFEGLATLQGVSLIPDVTVAGRTGIGVTVAATEGPDLFPETDEGGPSRYSNRTTLVLDPVTHELVGARIQAYDEEAGGKLVQQEDLAVEPLQVVAKLGVRPDGSTVKR